LVELKPKIELKITGEGADIALKINHSDSYIYAYIYELKIK
jgi:hypothetical protein